MSKSVCVILPVYNAQDWVGRAILSAHDSCPDASIVAVDDGSTDGSVDAIRALPVDLHLETGPNHGACHARNRGLEIALARGAQYVLFLDADDYIEGPMLAGALAEAAQHDADVVLSNMHLEYADGRREERHHYSGAVAPKDFFRGWMEGAYVNPTGILWRADFVREIGGWDESLARAQDLELTLRAMLSDPVIRKNEQGAAIHARVNDGSISRSQSERALSSRHRAVVGLIEKIQGTPFADITPLMQRELYHISRAAFKAGYRDLGRRGVDLLRAQGYRDHPGTSAHTLAARVLGLENKVRLWKG
jgi:glycosyltransferase involved in cell wall biosynthesis